MPYEEVIICFMKRHICISVIALFTCIQANAQTPYDSFAPETSRPILGILEKSSVDTINRTPTANAVPSTDNIRKWLSVDPLANKYPNISPYAYCGWNPINAIDPDGRDWYEAEGEIRWTELKSQQAMNKAKLAGKYLGEAVVAFNGYYDERLGKDGKLVNSEGEMPEGAKMANVTVYGSNGKDDIVQYLGYTMSSDPEKFGVLANGEYNVIRDSRMGPYGSPWAIEGRGKLSTLYDLNPAHPQRTPSYIDGVFVHRYNNDGFAGSYFKNNRWSGCSEGCLLIEPGKWGEIYTTVAEN